MPVAKPILQALAELGIDPEALAARNLPRFSEARRLVAIGLGTDGRDKFLAPGAARAWRAIRAAAAKDGVQLLLVSAFRSVEFQRVLIRGKLKKSGSLEAVLRVNAPPGYSEHHTGRAVDIGTGGCPPLDEAFERTEAFRWLERRARRFGFSLSYPRSNSQGFVYEPWHWRYR